MKKNCIRVFCTNGIHARDIYFNNSIPEPKIITYNTTNESLILIDIEGNVYQTTSIQNMFEVQEFSRLVATVSLEPAVQLTERTNKTTTITNTRGTHNIDMCFPICESGFVNSSEGTDIIHRVRERYTMQYSASDTGAICEGILTQDNNYIMFRPTSYRYSFSYRYAITNSSYALLNRFSGAYTDDNGVVQSITTIGRRSGEDDETFMGRILDAI